MTGQRNSLNAKVCVRVCYLIQLKELFPLCLCAAASDGRDVQHAVTELDECPPVTQTQHT